MLVKVVFKEWLMCGMWWFDGEFEEWKLMGFNDEFDWEVVWSVGEVDDFVDDFLLTSTKVSLSDEEEWSRFFPGFSEGSWWGCFCAFERDMCVCVLFVWFGFFGVAFMSYLDSGLLFDNNLGKTQLDKIGVILSTTWICFWLGLFFWLSYCSMYYSRIYLSKHHGQMKGSLRVV